MNFLVISNPKMPSLPADNKRPYAPFDLYRNFLPIYGSINHLRIQCNFFIWFILKWIFILILLLMEYYIYTLYRISYNDIANKYSFNLINESCRTILWYILILFFTQITIDSHIYFIPQKYMTLLQKNIYPRGTIFSIIYLICFGIHTGILLHLSTECHQKRNCPNLILNEWLCGEGTDQDNNGIMRCGQVTFYSMYKYVFGLPLNIFVFQTLNYVYYIIYYKCKGYTKDEHIVYKPHRLNSNSDDVNNTLSMTFRDSNRDDTQVINENNDRIGALHTNYLNARKVYEKTCYNITWKFYVYCTLFCVCFSLSNMMLYGVLVLNTNIISRYYTFFNYWLLCQTTFWKFVIKRIARQIDILRMQIPKSLFKDNPIILTQEIRKRQNTAHNFNTLYNGNIAVTSFENRSNTSYKLSLEIITESTFQGYYWLSHCYIFIYATPSIQTFIYIELFHFITIFCKAFIRPSEYYFNFMKTSLTNIGNIIFNKICCNCVRNNVLLSRDAIEFILTIGDGINGIDNTNTIQQWRERIAIDAFIRFLMSWVSCVTMILLLIMGKDKWYNIDSDNDGDNDWIKSIIVMSITLGLQGLLYFPMTCIVYKKIWEMYFVEPFLRFYFFNGWRFIFYLSFTYLLVCFELDALEYSALFQDD